MTSFSLKTLVGAVVAQMAAAKMTTAEYFYNKDRPLVIAHRGAFGHAPEESLASFVDAYYGGADFLEMDLQISKDLHLIVQHDETLNNTTSIYEYGGRWEDLQRDDGNWYVEDFTLVQLKMLRRFQKYQTYRSPMLNDRYDILTMNELIENVMMMIEDGPRKVNKGTPAGLYIELKDYDDKLAKGNDVAEMLFEVLKAHGISNIADATAYPMPIIIQSFDKNGLLKMATLTDLPLLQLCHASGSIYDYDDIATYANGVGVPSDWIMNSLSSTEMLMEMGFDFNKTTQDEDYSNFIQQMHDLELAVHPYTVQDDKLHYESKVYDETELYVNKGVDGLFVEFPHTQYVLLNHFGSKANFPAAAEAEVVAEVVAETPFDFLN